MISHLINRIKNDQFHPIIGEPTTFKSKVIRFCKLVIVLHHNYAYVSSYKQFKCFVEIDLLSNNIDIITNSGLEIRTRLDMPFNMLGFQFSN
jgi:hypothetical protein